MSLRQVITKAVMPMFERQSRRAVSEKLSHTPPGVIMKPQPQQLSQQQGTAAVSYASVTFPTRWKAIQYQHATA